MQLIKLNLTTLLAWWMQGDHYSNFENKFEQAWWFIQAIEVNTPKLNTDSQRYHFQATVIDQWPSKLNLFIDGLRQIATDAFARVKFGYKPDVPYANIFVYVILFPKHDPITFNCFACSHLSIIRCGRNAPLTLTFGNGRNNWIGLGIVISRGTVPTQLKTLHLHGSKQPGTLPTGLGHRPTEPRV